jgi:two-component system, NarL family, sensor histidine kinase DegS
MNVNFDIDNKTQGNKFTRLGVLYILALSAIAIVALIGQVLIQNHLQSQVSDSRVVNLAGTQRYLSQAIVKTSMLLCTNLDHRQLPDKITTLKKLLAQWKKGHVGLQKGDKDLDLPGDNSDPTKQMFAQIDPYFEKVYSSAQTIIDYKSENLQDSAQLNGAIRTLLDNEGIFLEKMNKIVFQFDQEARQKVSTLSRLEYILFAIAIIVIGLEIAFVFRPTTREVNQAISQLMSSEKNAKTLSKEIGALYASLEKSYEELSIVNQPVENPRLFAKADRGGNITFIGESLLAIDNSSNNIDRQRLCDLFPGMSHPDDWMDNVIDVVSEGESWQGEIRFISEARQGVWVQIIITPVFNESNDVEELVMMGADITLRKEAEQNMSVKNRAEIEKKINQQKFRSVLILEGQEEERKRIAMDIHDGIGQMLTSLKFQIESIDLNDNEKAKQKIREIEMLIKEVIREVRKVTFNLKPTVLGDFGLQAALNVFVKEIGKLTDIKLVYKTSREIDRLPQKIENNIFRIIQEAINNSIKYSHAQQISVELSQSNEELSVTVSDDGKGFDTSLVDARSMDIESGRGFFNMYERTEYVNGHLSIDTTPNKGTTVVLKIPIKNSVLSE